LGNIIQRGWFNLNLRIKASAKLSFGSEFDVHLSMSIGDSTVGSDSSVTAILGFTQVGSNSLLKGEVFIYVHPLAELS